MTTGITKSSTTSIMNMDEMFQKMEEYKFPSSLIMIDTNNHKNHRTLTTTTSSSSTTTTTSSVWMMDEYKKARDIYLQRKLLHNLIDHVTTKYDTHQKTIVNDIQVPNDDEIVDLQNQQQRILSMITNKASLVQQKRLELQNKYMHYQQRRDELYQLVQQEQNMNQSGIDDESDAVSVPDTTMEYDNQLLEQENHIRQLHKKRAYIQVQLSNVKQQHKVMTQNIQEQKVQFQSILLSSSSSGSDDTKRDDLDLMNHDWVEHPNETMLRQLQLQNSTLQSQASKVRDIESYYKNLLLLLETLNGIKFISTSTQNDTKCMIITVQVLQKYMVEIWIDIKTSNFYIQSAILISENAIVSGRPIKNGTKTDDNTKGEDMVVQLRIPNFDDIVQYVNMTCTKGENLRVLLREIIARLTMMEERVQMFTELYEEPNVVSTIGPFCTTVNNTNGTSSTDSTSTGTSNSNSNGTTTMLHDQEVVCSLNYPPMTVVLRCTGDCPLLENSIYIDELHGLGSGWDQNIVQGIVSRIHDQYKCSRPKQIIYAIRTEIQILVKEQQFVIPCTPRLPIRNCLNNNNDDDVPMGNQNNSLTNVFF
jgi:hypothetical protein